VTFKGLTVKGEGSGISYGSSLTGALKSIPALPKTIKAARHPKTKVILDEFTGCVKPGEMLLVLGRPGSGCSSFLKTLACQTDSFKEIDGTISYDGATPQEMAKHYRGDLAYLPEVRPLPVPSRVAFSRSAVSPCARLAQRSLLLLTGCIPGTPTDARLSHRTTTTCLT